MLAETRSDSWMSAPSYPSLGHLAARHRLTNLLIAIGIPAVGSLMWFVAVRFSGFWLVQQHVWFYCGLIPIAVFGIFPHFEEQAIAVISLLLRAATILPFILWIPKQSQKASNWAAINLVITLLCLVSGSLFVLLASQ
jgi:hypothetical protein